MEQESSTRSDSVAQSDTATCRYWAFLSYSSKDKRRASWLHRALETYPVPRSLVGTIMPTHEPAPRRFHPIFQDIADLPASSNLPDQIETSLATSRYLIVVASPRSAVSEWVNKEVEIFRTLGRDKRIFTIIVDGDPNSDGQDGCFSQALRQMQPLAADARRRRNRSDAKLRLLSGMMGIGFDSLKHRDTQRRIARLRLTLSAVILGISLAVALALFAWQQRRNAIQERQVAVARQLAAQSEMLQVEYGHLFERSVLLATESVRRSAGLAGDRVLRRGLALLPRTILKTSPGKDAHKIAISPDGTQLAIAEGQVLRIIEVSTGRRSQPLRSGSSIESMSFAPDGRFVLTLNSAGTAQAWKPLERHAVTEINGASVTTERSSCAPIAVAPNRPWAAVAGGDGRIRVWDLETRRTIVVYDPSASDRAEDPTTHGQEQQFPCITSLVFSPDGAYLVSASAQSWSHYRGPIEPSEIEIWEIETGRLIASATTPEVVVEILVDEDAKSLTTAGTTFESFLSPFRTPERTYTLRHWTRTETALSTQQNLNNMFNCSAISIDPTGTTVAGAIGDGTVRVWTVLGQTEIARLPGEPFAQAGVLSIRFGGTSRRLAILSRSSAGVFELEKDDPLVLRFSESGFERELSFSPDMMLAATTDTKDELCVWEPKLREVVWKKRGMNCSYPRFSPDGKYVAAFWNDGISVWDARTGRPISRMDAGYLPTFHNWFVFHNGGTQIISKGSDLRVHVWNVSTGKEFHRVECGCDIDPFSAISISNSGRKIAVFDNKDVVHVCDVRTGHELTRIEHAGVIHVVSFSPDDRYVATAAGFWRLSDGQAVAHMNEVSEERGLDLAFSPDGKMLAIPGPGSCAAVIWQVHTGRDLAHLTIEQSGHFMEPGTSSMAFSPDSRHFATCNASFVHVWDVRTWQEIARFRHANADKSVRFSPDGRFVVLGAKVFLWRPDDLAACACSILARNLTREEWSQNIGREPYRKTCPNLP